MLLYLRMTLGLSLFMFIILYVYIFAESLNHSLVSFYFCVLSFRGGEDNFFNFQLLNYCSVTRFLTYNGDATYLVNHLHLILFQVHCFLKLLPFEKFLFNREDG